MGDHSIGQCVGKAGEQLFSSYAALPEACCTEACCTEACYSEACCTEACCTEACCTEGSPSASFM